MAERRAIHPTRRSLATLTARKFTLVLGALALVSALVQLMLGASVLVVAIALCGAFSGLLGFIVLGAYNLGAWVALFYVFGNVLVALYGKTILLQPLDSNLYAPLHSYIAVTACAVALFVALMLVRRVGIGRPLLRVRRDPDFLAYLSWVSFAAGIVFWALNGLFQEPSGSGFGGIALFRDLLFMGVIARTAMLLEKSTGRVAFDGRLGWIIVVGVFLGLLENSKAYAALPVVSYFSTVLFYRRSLPLRQVSILVLGGTIFISVVAPMVHALRALGQQEMSIEQRVDFLASNALMLIEQPELFDRFEQLASGEFKGGYYNYFGGKGASQMLLGRYAAVQQIDPVIAAVDRQGPWGGGAVWPALRRLVPSFVYPGKPKYGEAYYTLVHYGLISPAGGKFPTLPLAGQAFAAYGIVGLVVIPFVTYLGFFFVAKKLGWQLFRNIYAVFFFCDFVIVYVNQGDFGQYAGAALRNFPLFAVFFILVSALYRIRLRRRLGRGYLAGNTYD